MTEQINVECVWYEPLPVVNLAFRRYHGHTHDATVTAGEIPLPVESAWVIGRNDRALDIPREDARWPTKCDGCDYLFTPSDGVVIYGDRRYVRPDTGEEVAASKLPIGAMSWGPLWAGIRCGTDRLTAEDGAGDGRCLFVIVPARNTPSCIYHGNARTSTQWEIDGLTAGSDRRRAMGLIGRTWTRTGTPPRITVEGGLMSPLGFGGTLIDGRLVGILETRD